MKTLALEQAIIKRLLEQEEPVSIQPNSTIYVDMDGVVVDFHTPMIGEINSILARGLPDFLHGSKTSRRALRKIKEQMGEEYRVGTKADLHNPLIRDLTFSIIKRKPYDYFVNLGQMKDGVEMLWPYVTSLPHRIEMLTASVQGLDPDKKTAEDAKKDWVATHLDPQPAAVNVVMGAARKIPYATSNGVPNVLIDDRSDTIDKWNEAGGIGILHTTGNSASTARRLKDMVAQVQEENLRQLIREELLSELDTSWTHAKTDEEDEDPGDPHTDYWDALKNSLNPVDWWKTAAAFWGDKEDPRKALVHDILTDLEKVPGVAFPAGLMNALIHHARGDHTKAGLSLGFAVSGLGFGALAQKAIANPGLAQKVFANIGDKGRQLGGKLKGHDLTILLRNADSAKRALAGMSLFTPAAGETAENYIGGLIDNKDVVDEVKREMARSQKLHNDIKEFKKARYRRYDVETVRAKDKSGQMHHGLEDHGKQMSVPTSESVVESVIKRLLSEQPYETPGQEYIALFLDGRSRDKLTDILDDPPPGWTLHADHMTVKFGNEGVPARYLGPATIRVVGVALNDRVMTAKVETDAPTQNAIPHITIATAPGAKPRESNDFSLDDFDDVDPIILKGEIRPKFSDTLQKKMPKI